MKFSRRVWSTSEIGSAFISLNFLERDCYNGQEKYTEKISKPVAVATCTSEQVKVCHGKTKHSQLKLDFKY